MKTNILYNEDCLIGMQKIENKSIDCIFCDLPFGITKNKWDNIIDFDLLWNQYKRIIKDRGIILLFASTPFNYMLYNSNPKMFKYEIIIEYSQPTGFLNANKRPLVSHGYIMVFYKKLPIYNPIKTTGHKKKSVPNRIVNSENYNYCKSNSYCSTERYPTTIQRYAKPTYPKHPTEKPFELCEDIIKTYTNKNDIVLDNCFGSGTIPLACLKNGRKYIGFEIKKKYYDIAYDRLLEFKRIYIDMVNKTNE
jgi:site-specific DNA-methyltransferase (adenine-specific)